MNEDSFVKEVKRKNRAGNVLIAAQAVLELAPRFLSVHMAGLTIAGTLTRRHLAAAGALMFAAFSLKAFCAYFATRWAHDAAYGALTGLRLRLVRHLKQLPLSFFQTRRVGGLTNVMEHDVEQAEFYLAHGLPEIMAATLFPAVIFSAALCWNWRLALLLAAPLPLMLLTKKAAASVWKKNQRHFVDSTRTMQESMMEYIQTIAVIKAFGREETKTAQALRFAEEYVAAACRASAGVSVSMGILDALMESGAVLMMIGSGSLLAAGKISVPAFVLSVILGGAFTSSVAKLATLQHYNIVFNESMRAVAGVLDVPAATQPGSHSPAANGDIRFCGVGFAYPGRERTLKDVTLTIPAGSHCALVGPSGCGKSTLIGLLTGFWRPQKGCVAIAGVDVDDLSEKQLNSLIAVAQQEAFLFHMSVEENIALGRQDASPEEIAAAAKTACAHDFISALPQGYRTKVGEGGMKLSGGERQRIALARVILKNAPIVILDEATSALDTGNERQLRASLAEFGKGKTVVTVTHRLKSVRNADRIVVMEAGRIVDSGTHAELAARCPLYRALLSRQEQAVDWNAEEEKR